MVITNISPVKLREVTLEEMLSISEVADRLGVDRKTVHRWARDGMTFPNAFPKNPMVKRSPYVIPVSDVVEFERRREGKTGEG